MFILISTKQLSGKNFLKQEYLLQSCFLKKIAELQNNSKFIKFSLYLSLSVVILAQTVPSNKVNKE